MFIDFYYRTCEALITPVPAASGDQIPASAPQNSHHCTQQNEAIRWIARPGINPTRATFARNLPQRMFRNHLLSLPINPNHGYSG